MSLTPNKNSSGYQRKTPSEQRNIIMSDSATPYRSNRSRTSASTSTATAQQQKKSISGTNHSSRKSNGNNSNNRQDVTDLSQLIMKRLEETGEKEILLSILRNKLIESGWRDDMKEVAKEFLCNSNSNNRNSKVTADELVSELIPKGKSLLNSMDDTNDSNDNINIKQEITNRVRYFMTQQGLSGAGGSSTHHQQQQSKSRYFGGGGGRK